MNDPVKIMLLGVAIMITGLFAQSLSVWEPGPPSNFIQIIFAAGFITTVAGFFYKNKA
ncbi:hypothetical protein V1502_11060 [Bacillus sp. SCS-153A]|uniref:hypothetical protein n=1 Tax=Rossellomorea sedimentorum TaxID=3115294 RepID=UPI0039065990